MNEQSEGRNWQTNLLITGGVILTVVMALLMSQIDLLQVQLQVTPNYVAALVPTDASNNTLVETKLPTVSLPTPTKTPAPTATPSSSGSATAVPMLIRCGNIPEGWAVYTVRANDSLLSLSAVSGTTVAAIAKANCIQNEFAFEGMIIYLPVRPPTPVPCGPPSWWIRYVVQPGDTLSSLAVRTGTTVYAIMQANCMDSTYLTAGRTIYLPRIPYTPPQPIPPTSTLIPTLIPTIMPTVPTITPVTVTPSPTDSSTLTPVPTTETATPTTPTATIVATISPSNTPVVIPTNTPVSTDTPIPPTATTLPASPTPLPATVTPIPPTITAVPPTATSVPAPPTNTPASPPTNTPDPAPTTAP